MAKLNIHTLTSDDSKWVHSLLTPIFDNQLSEKFVEDSLKHSDPTIMLGDPAVPIYIRLIYYEIAKNQTDLMPIPAGFSTQVVDLYPLITASDPDIVNYLDKIVIPTLAEGLSKMSETYPQVATMPLWAVLDKDLALIFQKNFSPTVKVIDNYIWHENFQDVLDSIKAWKPI